MDVLQGKKMAGVGNYLDATFIERGFSFSAFSSHYNGDFNAFFGFFLMKITLRSQKPPTFSNFSS